ncbi:Hypothetical predicted protein [Mytilus galloprovincialis]|uniref:C2H2-type domain-containing protein n=1 Tax=Mytilus galloprovincialis TaxID=29158 RepID=A0A8B6D8Y8_MYTGA|nr:Hypothetical predicted protein [Mytilus galloprovincialis]
MSFSNSSSKERSISDVTNYSPNKSATFKIEPPDAVENNDVFMESAVKVLTQERLANGSSECLKMAFIQKEHPLTTQCIGSEQTTIKEQVHHFPCLQLQTEEQERHGFQNAKPQFPILHQHFPVISRSLLGKHFDQHVSKDDMANEEHAKVLLPYKRALFPGNIKKNFQHRYFIQSRSDSTSSDDSTFDLEDTAMSVPNSPTKERSIVNLPSHSPCRSSSCHIESSNAMEDNDVFMESAVKVLTQKRSANDFPVFSKMSFTHQEHELTVGSEHTTTKEQVNQFACLPTQKYSRSAIAISTEAEERYGFQNAKPPFPILHHHFPGFLSPQFLSSANLTPFHSIHEGCHMFFDFDKSTLLTGFIPDQDMSTPSPVMPPAIHFEFTPRERMFKSMSELNGITMPPIGCFPNQKINISTISSELSTLKQHCDQRRALSDSDAYKCPVCNQMFLSFDNLAKHIAKHLPTETIVQDKLVDAEILGEEALELKVENIDAFKLKQLELEHELKLKEHEFKLKQAELEMKERLEIEKEKEDEFKLKELEMRERLEMEKLKIEMVKEESNTKVQSKSEYFDAAKKYTFGSQIL